MAGRRTALNLQAVAALLVMLGCGGQGSGPTPPTRTVTSLEIVAPASSLEFVGQTIQLAARLTYSDGTTEEVTAQATRSSSDPGVATVSAGGLVTAVTSGSAVVSATAQVRTATKSVTVDLSGDSGWVFLGAVFAAGVTDAGVHDLVVDRADSHLLYVAADRGLFVSRNLGATWTQHHSTPPGNNPGLLAQDPNDPDRVYYGVRNELRVSADRGARWQVVRAFASGSIRSVEISRLDGRMVFVGLQSACHPHCPRRCRGSVQSVLLLDRRRARRRQRDSRRNVDHGEGAPRRHLG